MRNKKTSAAEIKMQISFMFLAFNKQKQFNPLHTLINSAVRGINKINILAYSVNVSAILAAIVNVFNRIHYP